MRYAVKVRMEVWFLLLSSHTQVIVLAKSALDAAQSEPVQALCLCLLARAHHAQGQYDEALSTYAKALQFNTNLGLAHLGLAQLYVRQSNIINASTELDLALKASPGLFEALKVCDVHPPPPPPHTHAHIHTQFDTHADTCKCSPACCVRVSSLSLLSMTVHVCVCACVCVCVFTDCGSGGG